MWESYKIVIENKLSKANEDRYDTRQNINRKKPIPLHISSDIGFLVGTAWGLR